MEDGPLFFTLDEANALLPALRLALGDVARLRSELEHAIVAIGGAEIAAAVLQRSERPPRGREAEAAHLLRVAGQVTGSVERVNAMGCVLKDADAGLVDFYSLRDDEPVFLCWQLGEPVVSHWHPLEGGFASREPIEGVQIERPRLVN